MLRPIHHLAAAILLLTATPGKAVPKSAIAFVHASVVPMDRAQVLRDQTVVVERGRIVAMGPSATVKVPRGARRIEARGRYLLPALSDMHVHVEGESWNALLDRETRATTKDLPFEDLLFPYVAQGVTTVQVLSATHELLAVRSNAENARLVAPRLILARMIDGPGKAWPPPLADWVSTASEAASATRNAKAAGYDKMKVYSFLNKQAYDAIIAAAKQERMDVVGHIPYDLSVEYVVDSGQKMISHTEEVAKHAHGDYSPERISYFAKRIADGGVWLTPTLVTTRRIIEDFSDPQTLFARPEAVYAGHPVQKQIWNFISAMNQKIPPDSRAKLHADFEKFQKPFTKVFHDHGGQLMTGTDSLLPRLVPGFALHQELNELVAVGLTPFEALRTSTTIPCEYLGESERCGTIAVGKSTDLLLLADNPLADVSAASRIEGVLMRGDWIPKAVIDRKMKRIVARNHAASHR